MTATPPAPPPLLGAEKDAALIWARVRKRAHPLISVAFTVPVFLAYHLGLFLGRHIDFLKLSPRSPTDVVSALPARLMDISEPAYVLMTLALALAVLVATWVQQKRGKIAESPAKRVFWEGVGGGVLGVALLGWVSLRVLPVSMSAALAQSSVFDRIVMALGGAFYVESVFRAGVLYGSSWIIGKLTKLQRQPLVLGLSVLLSCLLYTLAHYFVIFDEAFSWAAAGFHMAEGLYFATVFVLRGFAVAVYAHMFYNLVTSFIYF